MLDWWKRRKERQEFERQVQARQGRARIKRHINRQRQMLDRLREMMRRALLLKDERQFRALAKQYIWTQQDIRRWERNLLAFDSLQARRDQVKATREFLESMQALSRSILVNADPAELARMEQDLQMALARAQTMEEVLDAMMEAVDESVFTFEEIEEKDLAQAMEALAQDLTAELSREAAAASPEASEPVALPGEATSALDRQIDELMKRIEEELRNQGKWR